MSQIALPDLAAQVSLVGNRQLPLNMDSNFEGKNTQLSIMQIGEREPVGLFVMGLDTH